MTESKEAHPLNNVVAAGEQQKKKLSHVEVKKTSDMLSEVRQEGKETLKNHVAPVSKQGLLSAVRIESGETKKRLAKVETKAVSGLMTELRGGATDKK